MLEQRLDVVRRGRGVERGIRVAVLREPHRIAVVGIELLEQRARCGPARRVVGIGTGGGAHVPLGSVAIDQGIVMEFGRDVDRESFEHQVVGIVAPDEFVGAARVEQRGKIKDVVGKMPAAGNAAVVGGLHRARERLRIGAQRCLGGEGNQRRQRKRGGRFMELG